MMMSNFGREWGVVWWVCSVLSLFFVVVVRVILYGRFFLLECVGLIVAWGIVRHFLLERDMEYFVYMTNWTVCRAVIVVMTCVGMELKSRAVNGRIRSALNGSKNADPVPGEERW